MDSKAVMPRSLTYPEVSTDLPGPLSTAYLRDWDRLFYGPMADHAAVPFMLARKSPWLLVDADGNTFADHVSAWGMTPLSSHPDEVFAATYDAMERYGLEITDYVPSLPPLALARRLLEIAPPGLTRVAPGISGTEVVEQAVKLAREATGRPMILSFLGQYHGESTYLTAALGTDLAEVTSNSAQYVSGVVFAPYPNAFRAPFHRGPGPYDDTLYVDFIEDWIAVHQVEPEQLAAVLIEPIAGEGGVLIPSGAFWGRLVAFCERNGIKIILDEVQTGIGRCGTMFAAERWGLEPDLLLLAKGLAGGAMPIAAILGTEAVMARSETLGSGTFAWVPPACAGALANIDLIIRDRILENVERLDAIARQELVPLVASVEQVGDVRIAGAMIGIEFVQSKDSIRPAPAFQSAVHDEAVRRGVFGMTQSGKWVYRLQPPLNMPPALFEWSCHQVADAIAAVAKAPPRETAGDLDQSVRS